MDEHEQAIARDIAAAAAIHAAKREVDGAIAALAASPLSEAAADRMREVLASPKLRKARRALTRLQKPRSPHLSVVGGNGRAGLCGPDPGKAQEPEEPVGAIAGGAA